MHLEMPVRVTAAKLASPSSRPDRRETFPSPQKVKPVSRIIAFSDASHPPCRLNFLPWNPVGLPWKDKNQPWNVVGLPWSLVFQPCRDVFLSGGAVRLPCGHVFLPWSAVSLPWSLKFLPWNVVFLPWMLIFNNLRRISLPACRNWSKIATFDLPHIFNLQP
jgi:hypothetical protein